VPVRLKKTQRRRTKSFTGSLVVPPLRAPGFVRVPKQLPRTLRLIPGHDRQSRGRRYFLGAAGGWRPYQLPCTSVVWVSEHPCLRCRQWQHGRQARALDRLNGQWEGLMRTDNLHSKRRFLAKVLSRPHAAASGPRPNTRPAACLPVLDALYFRSLR